MNVRNRSGAVGGARRRRRGSGTGYLLCLLANRERLPDRRRWRTDAASTPSALSPRPAVGGLPIAIIRRPRRLGAVPPIEGVRRGAHRARLHKPGLPALTLANHPSAIDGGKIRIDLARAVGAEAQRAFQSVAADLCPVLFQVAPGDVAKRSSDEEAIFRQCLPECTKKANFHWIVRSGRRASSRFLLFKMDRRCDRCFDEHAWPMPSAYIPQRSAGVCSGASHKASIGASTAHTVIEQPAISSEVTYGPVK